MTDPIVGQLVEVLKRYWGYDSFHDLQLPAMTAVMESRDSLVVLPTGGGKSLCYQAPAVCLDGMAIVISPLISLMKDQVDALQANGIPAALINSTLSLEEKRDVASRIQSGEIKLVYLAPEALGNDRLLNLLSQVSLSFIAIDEAHCISQWGHDFRPHYRELKNLRKRFPNVAMHAYTATATERVRSDIQQQLGLNEPEVLIGNFDRPNLYYRLVKKDGLIDQVQAVIEKHVDQSGIIYCISRKEVERVTAQLQGYGYRAAAYHAGLDDHVREQNQNDFINDRIQIIVATVAFGMGIDKPDVRFVIHTGIPKTIENYQQETGRAGRDGLEAECHLFYGGNDVRTWKMIFSDQPTELRRASEASLQAMVDFCYNLECRHQSLVKHFGQQLEQDCQTACDICAGDHQFVNDSLKISQMILSSVFRQGERFGSGYTSRVLKGAEDERITANNHDQLSTFGLLESYPLKTIQSWIQQLVGQGHLKIDESDGYSILKISSTGGDVLKGKATPRLIVPEVCREPAKSSSSAKTKHSMKGADDGLFQELRKLRLELAREKNVPPYVVFGDASLIDMARRRPSNESNFLLVQGVGQKKCREYGETFLTLIKEYSEQNNLTLDVADITYEPAEVVERPVSQNSRDSFVFFEKGMSLPDVAGELGRAESTVTKYLTDYIRDRKMTDPSPWVSADIISQVNGAIEQIKPSRLKELYLHFDEQIDYKELRIVFECYRNRD